MKKFSDINAVFDYNINSDDKTIYEGAVLVNITGKELAKIAELIESNSGHPVEFDSLPSKFVQKVQEAASEDFEKAVNLDEDDFIDYWPDINNILPPTLIHEVEQHSNGKCVSVNYSVNIGGKNFRDTAKINISVEDFYKFAGYQLELHVGYKDFEWLKERDRELFDKINTLVSEWSKNKFSPSGKTLVGKVELQKCPSEIVQYLDCPDYCFWKL